MLVLTRKTGESIKVGEEITITIIRAGNAVRIGIEAPPEVRVVRSELEPREPTNVEAS